MGVVPSQVGAALEQPSQEFHQDPLPVRSDPPRESVPRPVDENVEHSATATQLAIGEALQRLDGARTGEYQQPKSPLAIHQLKKAGLSDAEIAILTRSTGAPQDATANIVPAGPRGYRPGEMESLESTASYWDDQAGKAAPPGRYYAGDLAQQARSALPDARARKMAADRVMVGLGLERRR